MSEVTRIEHTPRPRKGPPPTGKLTREEEVKRINATITEIGAPTWESSQFSKSPRHKPKVKQEPVRPPEWDGYKKLGVHVIRCNNPACDEGRERVTCWEHENGKLICEECSWDQQLQEIDFTHMEMIANS